MAKKLKVKIRKKATRGKKRGGKKKQTY